MVLIGVVIAIILTTVLKCLAGGAGVASTDVRDVQILMYENVGNHTPQVIGGQQIPSRFTDGEQAVKILIHGYDSNISSDFPQNCKDAYKKNLPSAVVIVVDWSKLAQPTGDLLTGYMEALPNVVIVGYYVGQFLVELGRQRGKLSLRNVHVVGFSLGAHVAGYAAIFLKSKHGLTLERITARCQHSIPHWFYASSISLGANGTAPCLCRFRWVASVFHCCTDKFSVGEFIKHEKTGIFDLVFRLRATTNPEAARSVSVNSATTPPETCASPKVEL